MVTIKIHRGSHQIGGCSTEIECNGERILIDLGSNLPGAEAAGMSDTELLDNVFGKDGKRHFDGILFSHYHGDHVGQYKMVPGIGTDHEPRMFIGSAAKDIMQLIASYTDRDAEIMETDILEHMEVYKAGEPLAGFRQMEIIPLHVDHSALDAYMFFIKVGGKKILFTGDFRDHGIANEKGQLWRTLDKYVGESIDVLITEGTMLSRTEESAANIVRTEKELGKKAGKFFKEKKYNFALVSSTNLDTIMEFYHNTPDDKLFVCDAYQARMIMTSVLHMYKKSSMYQGKTVYKTLTKMIYIYGKIRPDDYKWLNAVANAIKQEGYPPIFFKQLKGSDKSLADGFVMLVRANRFYERYGESEFELLVLKYRDKYPMETQFIYSMWKGYLNGKTTDKDILRITGREEKIVALHTSGHAYVETIAKLIGMINPGIVIPMHTEMADSFKDFDEFSEWKNRVRVLQDGETLCL